MKWMDGRGKDGQGPCDEDLPGACPQTVRISDFLVDWSLSPPTPSPASPLDTAMAALNTKAQQGGALAQAGAVGGGACSGDCELSAPQDSPSDQRIEVSIANSEWEVMVDAVVREAPQESAKVLKQKVQGAVLVGKRSGDWLELSLEPGFVAVATNRSVYLKERLVDYSKLGSKSCEEAGMFPITDRAMCGNAAYALGYLDSSMSVDDGEGDKPYGCYFSARELFFVSNEANKGNKLGKRMMLCVSKAYPVISNTIGAPGNTTANDDEAGDEAAGRAVGEGTSNATDVSNVSRAAVND